MSALLLPVPSIAQWAIASAVYLLLLAVLRAFPSELLHVLARRSG